MSKETQDKIDTLLKQKSDEQLAAKKSGKPYINSELSKSIRQLRLSLRPKDNSSPFGDNKGYGQGRYMGDSVEVSNYQPLIKENQMKTLKQIKESLIESAAPDQTHIAEATEQKSHIDPMAQYKRNEDQNYHSENVAHIANHVGSREDRIMADHIASAHNSIGHLPKELADHRQALNDKLWPKFKAKFGE